MAVGPQSRTWRQGFSPANLMTDRDRRHVRGPVHTMRTESAEWDDASESHYGPQTSYTTNQYDAGGRLTEIESRVDAGPKAGTPNLTEPVCRGSLFNCARVPVPCDGLAGCLAAPSWPLGACRSRGVRAWRG